MGSLKGKKRRKSFRYEALPISSKRKINVTIDEPVLRTMPLNIIEPLPTSLDRHTSPPPSLGPQASAPSVRDLRKRKGVIDDLTTNIDGIALYQGMTPKNLYHYMYQPPFMAHKRQLNAICEDVVSKVVISRILYHMCHSNLFFLTSHSLTCFLL